jgi:hypothetical protein
MTRTASGADPQYCVLIFAPIGRDAELTRDLLGTASIPCDVHRSIASLVDTLGDATAGAVLLTEEALDDPDFPALVTSLEQQPAWSDCSPALPEKP